MVPQSVCLSQLISAITNTCDLRFGIVFYDKKKTGAGGDDILKFVG